ncbi:hypothetical protein ACFVGN_40905, partial [Streptomyces sp. NPDC057757]|uniref:hypothetical protein n=1 Tax=Streptomyces sp. NPDC057757 TaxID=3346241 RepID=UPI0036C6DC03
MVEQVEGVVDTTVQTGRTIAAASIWHRARVGMEGLGQGEEQVEFGCGFAGGQRLGVDTGEVEDDLGVVLQGEHD